MAERPCSPSGVRARGRSQRLNQTSTGHREPWAEVRSKVLDVDESRQARFEWLCHIVKVDVASDNVASRGPLRNH
jgi:hypothetical protein